MYIPKFEYFDADMKSVPSAADPAWHYTVMNGQVRTRKDGPPQHLVDGKWVDLEKPKT